MIKEENGTLRGVNLKKVHHLQNVIAGLKLQNNTSSTSILPFKNLTYK